jgi:uncharacterized membrane protein
MSSNPQNLSSKIQLHIRHNLLSGLFILLPIGITILILKFLFAITAGFFVPVISKIVETIPSLSEIIGRMMPLETFVVISSLVVFVAFIYFCGILTSYLIGKKLLAWGESLITKIPIMKTIYSGAKNVIESLSASSSGSFKSVVLVDFPRVGILSIGFVTSGLSDSSGKEFLTVFVPTTPNPTSGFLCILPKEEVRMTQLSIEDGIKLVVSGGLLSSKYDNLL